jgi:manganese transport protein
VILYKHHERPPPLSIIFYISSEIAIAACDPAEVLGMAMGLNLLFWYIINDGVIITVLIHFVAF